MFSSIKQWIYAAFAAVLASLGLYAAYQSRRANKAEDEADMERERGDQYRNANQENEQVIEKVKEDARVKEDIARLDSYAKRERLRKYSRDSDKI